ncbi:MAG TPA: DUF4198 domain-containing protein [Gemmataceae bacterium]|jgi:uncharacterized GH25 family protein|nr:DUF4198 domain-containing protein [Gemmataceae bacterium]
MRHGLILSLTLATALPALAHDTWVQTNTNLIRTGDAVHIDLMLGNHGNDHRDFKLASKPDLDGATLAVTDPAGKTFDVIPKLADLGYAPKEGFHSAKFAADKPGLYVVSHTQDKVVNHGKPVRSIRSAKAFFLISPTLDKVSRDWKGFDKPLGHALELVPDAHPITPMGPGVEMKVRVLFQGKPLPEARVSFIPRGETLAADFDKNFERKTDTLGKAAFTPKTGNYYLIVVHHKEAASGKAEYDTIAYTATLTIFVPDICPCCGE